MRTVRMIGSVYGLGAGPSKGGWFREADGTAKYRVQGGDSLSALASKYLGKSSRYPEIVNAQPAARKATLTKNPGLIQVGEVLLMPREAVTTAERLGLVPAPSSPTPTAKPAAPPPAAKPAAPPRASIVSTSKPSPQAASLVLPWTAAPPPAQRPAAPPPKAPPSGPNPEDVSDEELQRKADETGKMQCVAGKCFMPEIEIVASPPPKAAAPMVVSKPSASAPSLLPSIPGIKKETTILGVPWTTALLLGALGLGGAYVLKNRKSLMG